jgi:hypothetical protein
MSLRSRPSGFESWRLLGRFSSYGLSRPFYLSPCSSHASGQIIVRFANALLATRRFWLEEAAHVWGESRADLVPENALRRLQL